MIRLVKIQFKPGSHSLVDYAYSLVLSHIGAAILALYPYTYTHNKIVCIRTNKRKAKNENTLTPELVL